MGLFSTLASATTGTSSDGQANLKRSPQTLASSTKIPTLFQLYAGDNNQINSNDFNQRLISLENIPHVTGYTTLTYQAVQVGASRDESVEVINKHSNPDLGVWNYRVAVTGGKNVNNNDTNDRKNNTGREQSSSLTNSLLSKLTHQTSVYCLTVDLSDATSVEPNLSALQAALVRLLIEQASTTSTNTNKDADTDPTSGDINDDIIDVASSQKSIKATSLYDLQSVQFGLASEEKAIEQSIEESAREIKIGLMICAIVAPSSDDSKELVADLSSESAYKKKQARALVVYHLRKFANAINAALCFVEHPTSRQHPSSENGTNNVGLPADATNPSGTAVGNNDNDETKHPTNAEDAQIAISYDKLSQLWRDMAMGVPIWQQLTEGEDAATALYGPGRQQEDLIENLLLRNANYPGHWNASKDSLWVALPAANSNNDSSNQTRANTTTGDDGWLSQLRQSIASALPASDKSSSNEKTTADDDANGKPKEKDAAVSSFFESLLKNP